MRNVFLLLAILSSLVSCARVDYESAARESEPLRLLLLRYYEANGHFPGSLDSLKALDPAFDGEGDLWKRWYYTANYSSSYDKAYAVWTYPGPTRQSLWFKFNPERPSETGWFIDNENGSARKVTAIPLLPQERDLLRRKSGTEK